MDILSKKVFEVLDSNNVSELHHSNSVLTACSFLSRGSLMSRGNAERENALQTSQSSDGIDKKYGVWFDVFVDTMDIHKRGSRRNSYGPVLFVLDATFLKKETIGKVWVSKLNPTKWSLKSREERWFSSSTDLADNFIYGEFDQMVLLRHCGGALPIKNYLKKIILDDPYIEYSDSKIDFYSMAYGALKYSMALGGIDVPIEKRVCSVKCSCVKSYQADTNIDKWFSPSLT